MPFGNFTVGSSVFEPRNPGTYVEDSIVLGDPLESITFRPVQNSGSLYRLSVSTISEKIITVDSSDRLVRQTWTLSGNMPTQGFTPADARLLVTRLYTIYTESIISRHALGEV